jgi:hypothetical protein
VTVVVGVVVVGAAVVGAAVAGVVAAVPAVAVVPSVAEVAAVVVVVVVALTVTFAVARRALAIAADLEAAFAAAVDAVALAARPANTPVPVNAPTSDQRVRALMRKRPASRSLRLRWLTDACFMSRILVGCLVSTLATG